MINVVAHCDEANRSRIYTDSLISQQIWNVIEHRWSLQKIQDGNTKITEIHQSSTGRRRQRYEMQYRGSMDRIWSHELLDIGAGPGRQGVIALDEPAVVFEERESLSPESLPPLPVSLDERWVFRWIRHVCCCCFFFLLFESELSSVLPSSSPIQWLRVMFFVINLTEFTPLVLNVWLYPIIPPNSLNTDNIALS